MNEVDNCILSAFEDNDIERRFVADCNEVIHFKLGSFSHDTISSNGLIYYFYDIYSQILQFAVKMILNQKRENFNLKCHIKYLGKRKFGSFDVLLYFAIGFN